jgi:hypothetical protein
MAELGLGDQLAGDGLHILLGDSSEEGSAEGGGLAGEGIARAASIAFGETAAGIVAIRTLE